MVKAVLIFMMILFLPFYGMGEIIIVTPDQKTVSWDANPSNEMFDVTYEVFILPSGKDREVESNWQLVGSTEGLQMAITFTVEDKYIVGVRCYREVGGEFIYSSVNWSDVNGEWTPEPFVILYAVTPFMPKGLRTTTP
jgi:hypothetical protein